MATIISALIGFEQKVQVPIEQIEDPLLRESLQSLDMAQQRMAQITERLAEIKREATEFEKEGDVFGVAAAADVRSQIPLLEFQQAEAKREKIRLQLELHHIQLHDNGQTGEQLLFSPPREDDAGGAKSWHLVKVNQGMVTLSAGGNVVGAIPKGLPGLEVPTIEWGLVLGLLPAALVMALIGFMEATSISKAIATKTGERVDTNKELIGQGLANIAGSFFSSFTVSGSFSRSAVAAKLGAQTGLFAIVSALGVVLVLLFFTKYLYHLPQAVLAVIVMMAVFSLIRIQPLIQAWKVDRVDAVIGISTFFATLIMAPAIANGILFGVVLTVIHYLIGTMRPRAEIVARKPDGTLGGIRANRLKPMSQSYVPVRFDGPLSFINVAYFEDIILEAHADFPDAKVILVIGSGINDIDASGAEKICEVAKRLNTVGVRLVFSGLKHQVRKLLEKGGVKDSLGQESFYPDKATALRDLQKEFGELEAVAPPPAEKPDTDKDKN